MRVRGFLFLLAGALALIASLVLVRSQSGESFNAPAALRELSADTVIQHMRVLSSDQFEGRGPSTPGGALAAEYLAQQLAASGLEPGGTNGSYFQQVPMLEATVVDDQTRVSASAAGASHAPVPLRLWSEVAVFSPHDAARIDVSGELVFVGHGIVAPEYQWDDYGTLDMAGRIALIMANEPAATVSEPALFDGDALTYYGRWTYKFEEAARQGAAGAVILHTDESATYPWQVVRSSWSGRQYAVAGMAETSGPVFEAWVTEDAAARLVRLGGHDLSGLREAAFARGSPPVPLGVSLAASVVRRVISRESPNVIGVLRGSDAREAVLMTSHYDHLGVRAAAAGEADGIDRIYNGALDNASGVAGTLAIAAAFARSSVQPRRSIYVAFTTAEESGLLGSAYLASNPPLPIEDIVANVNIDQLNVFGASRDLVLIGAERSTVLDIGRRLAGAHRRVIATDPEPAQGNYFRSDHFSLARKGVPAVSVGLPTQFIGPQADAMLRMRDAFNERDYHQPSDEMRDGWSFEGAVNDLRLLGELVWQLATASERPAYNRAP